MSDVDQAIYQLLGAPVLREKRTKNAYSRRALYARGKLADLNFDVETLTHDGCFCNDYLRLLLSREFIFVICGPTQ